MEIAAAIRFHHGPSCVEGDLAGVVAAADILSNVLLKEDREVTAGDFESAPQGTAVPRPDLLKRIMEELPAVIASSRELLGGTSEVLPVGADSDRK